MASNVFTKNEILQNLASRGYFIDIYTLDAFFQKKRIEAIFEDDNGNELFDKNALNIVLEGLFNADPQTTSDMLPNQAKSVQNDIPESKIEDQQTYDALKNISLSDGTPLLDKVQDIQSLNTAQKPSPIVQEQQVQTSTPMNIDSNIQSSQNITSSQSIITPEINRSNNDIFASDSANDALLELNQDETTLPDMTSDLPGDLDDASAFDDITLLSESLEAQEKLRQYVVDELSKKNMDVTPKSNEFKLDISERTLNMIARTMAKKIAKYVGSIMAQDAKDSSKIVEFQEENRRLAQKTRELEEQNRKLRLLLAESNKNLNSYKPSIFGLYKKVDPKTNK